MRTLTESGAIGLLCLSGGTECVATAYSEGLHSLSGIPTPVSRSIFSITWADPPTSTTPRHSLGVETVFKLFNRFSKHSHRGMRIHIKRHAETVAALIADTLGSIFAYTLHRN